MPRGGTSATGRDVVLGPLDPVPEKASSTGLPGAQTEQKATRGPKVLSDPTQAFRAILMRRKKQCPESLEGPLGVRAADGG